MKPGVLSGGGSLLGRPRRAQSWCIWLTHALGCQAAMRQSAAHRSLHGLTLHRLPDGRIVAPIFTPERDGLPFALALELHRDPAAGAGSQAAGAGGTLSLQYIMDGQGQVAGEERPVNAGDSILVEGALDAQRAPRAAVGGAGPSGWDAGDAGPWASVAQCSMVNLTILLPDQAIDSHTGSSLSEEAAAWQRAPVVGSLSQAAAAGILKQTRASTLAALSASDAPDAQPAPRPSLAEPGVSAYPRQDGAGVLAEASDQPGSKGRSIQQSIAEAPASALRRRLAGVAALAPQDLLQALPGMMGRLAFEVARGGPLLRAAPRAAQPPLQRRCLQELHAFRLPGQTNRLALIFDPLSDQVPFTFGVEIFEAGHRTTPHTHPTAHELFFILAGAGEAFCDTARFAVGAGDAVVFPPGAVHGLDVGPSGRMYCLELMTADDMFAELVRAGQPLGRLAAEDLCVLAALGCAGGSGASGGLKQQHGSVTLGAAS